MGIEKGRPEKVWWTKRKGEMKEECKKCSISTGIHEHELAGTLDENGKKIPWGLTFGRGELDDFGYWEIPCAECARRNEKIDKVPVGTYWPFQ